MRRYFVGFTAAALAVILTPTGTQSLPSAAARTWQPTERLASATSVHDVSMGPRGRATAVWTNADGTYAARRPVGGGWREPRRFATGAPRGDIAVTTLSNGRSVIAVIRSEHVTIFRWRNDGSISRGQRFRPGHEESWAPVLVANRRSDLVLSWQAFADGERVTVCRYFQTAVARWRGCNHPAGFVPKAVDARGRAYAVSDRRLGIYRPGQGWTVHRYPGRRLRAVSANGIGDLAVLAVTPAGGAGLKRVEVKYRPAGGGFGRWREIREFDNFWGPSEEVHVHANGAVSAIWDEGPEGRGRRSVHVAWRGPGGRWHPSHRLIGGSLLDSFASNPRGDAVATFDHPHTLEKSGSTRAVGSGYVGPVQLSGLGTGASEVAIDNDGDAIVLYNASNARDLVSRAFEAG